MYPNRVTDGIFPRDGYAVSGNVEAEYVDADQTVLRNKRGITVLSELQRAEEQALARAYQQLFARVRADTPITALFIRDVHDTIFGELYEWAGRWRSVWLSKPGVVWPPPDYLEASMETFEQNVLKTSLAGSITTVASFCAAAARIQGEFLVIHPFREGNARTIKLITDLLAGKTGRPPLLYDQTPEGIHAYINAAKAAFNTDYEPLERVIRAALRDHPS